MGGQVFDIADRECWVERAIEIRENNRTIRGYDSWLAEGEDVVLEFMSQWKVIRAYHGCSTSNVKPYYERGILPLDVDSANRKIYNIFLGEKIPLADIKLAIEKHRNHLVTREGRVYVELNRKVLLQECGHYLIYGSEYILGVAGTLEKLTGKPCREFLSTRGKPTLLVCEIPTEIISKPTLTELGCHLISRDGGPNEVFKQMLSSSFGFSFRQRISPQLIVSHLEFTRVFNPLTRTTWNY